MSEETPMKAQWTIFVVATLVATSVFAQEAPDNIAEGVEYELLTRRSYGRSQESDLTILTDGTWRGGFWTRANTLAWRSGPGDTIDVLVDLGSVTPISGVSIASVHGRAAHPPSVIVRAGETMDRLFDVTSWDAGEGLEVAPDDFDTMLSRSPAFRAAGRYVLFTLTQPPLRPGGSPRSGLICVTELMVHSGEFDPASVEMTGEPIALRAYMEAKDPFSMIPPISADIETPHIDWAPDPDGGRPDVLTVVEFTLGRDPVELEQRVGMNQRIFSLLRQGPQMSYFRTQDLLEELEEAPDVLLLAGIDWGLLRPEAQAHIMERVRGGMNLLWVHPRGETDQLRATLNELPEPAFPVIDSPLESMPFPLLDDLRDGAFGEVRAGTVGEGRVVAWRYENADGERFVEMNSALWPQMPGRNTPEDFPAWEIYAAHLVKMLCWAAHGEADAIIQGIETERVGAEGIALTAPIAGDGARLRGVLLDEHGREVATAEAAPPALSFEQPLQTGPHCAIVWLEDEQGRQIDWRCALVEVEGPSITDLTLDANRYEGGEDVGVTVRSEGAGGLRLRAELRDQYDGLIAVAEAEAGPEAMLTLSTDLSRSLTCMLHVTLTDGQRLVDERFRLLPTVLPEDLAEYQVGLWASYGSYIGKRHWGDAMLTAQEDLLVDFAIAGHPPGYPRHGMRPCPENMYRIFFKGADRYEEMNLAAPGFREEFLEAIRPRIEDAYDWGAYDYSVGDECGYALREDEHTLAAFREWLRDRHGNAEALNEAWGTSFATFEDVQFGEEAPLAQGLAERVFGDWLFADTLMAARRAGETVDPHNRVGISGTRDPAHYIGFDWWRLMNTLTHLTFYDGLQRECIRSWRKPGDMLTSFIGYDYADTNEVMARYFPWLEVFSGMQGVSIYSASSGDLGGYVRPDLTLTNRARWHIEEVSELKRGIAKALLTAERAPAPLALLYSQRSIHLAKMLGRPALANLTSASEIIKDIGLQFDFISSEQLEAGALAEGDYRVFMLLDALALSDAQLAAADAFARAGGTVINFGPSGAFTEHGKPREGTDVEALRWERREEPLDPAMLETRWDRTAVGEGERIDCDFLVDEYRQFQPSGVAGETVERYSAKEDTARGWQSLFRSLLMGKEVAPPATVLDLDGTAREYMEVVQFERGPIGYLGVLPRYFGGRYWRGGGEMSVDDTDFSPAVIHLPDQAHVYDMRAQKYLGQAHEIEAALATGVARLYALLPYRVTDITLDCPARAEAGGLLTARCNLTARDETPGDHVVHWTLTRGAEVLPPFARNTVAAGGSGEASFRLPLDMSGEWTLTATDVISGETTSRTVTIEALER
ncbi:MAG: beta-galactosidase [Armatimonadota bacterium]